MIEKILPQEQKEKSLHRELSVSEINHGKIIKHSFHNLKY